MEKAEAKKLVQHFSSPFSFPPRHVVVFFLLRIDKHCGEVRRDLCSLSVAHGELCDDSVTHRKKLFLILLCASQLSMLGSGLSSEEANHEASSSAFELLEARAMRDETRDFPHDISINSNFIVQDIKENCHNNFWHHRQGRSPGMEENDMRHSV